MWCRLPMSALHPSQKTVFTPKRCMYASIIFLWFTGSNKKVVQKKKNATVHNEAIRVKSPTKVENTKEFVINDESEYDLLQVRINQEVSIRNPEGQTSLRILYDNLTIFQSQRKEATRSFIHPLVKKQCYWDGKSNISRHISSPIFWGQMTGFDCC